MRRRRERNDGNRRSCMPDLFKKIFDGKNTRFRTIGGFGSNFEVEAPSIEKIVDIMPRKLKFFPPPDIFEERKKKKED